jgi:hypothetical protein
MSERSGAKDFQPVVMPGLQGKGLVRQRSLFDDLIFCFFLIKQKEGASAATSGECNSGTPNTRDAEINSA